NDRTAVRLQVDDAHAGQGDERLADRRVADAEAVGQVLGGQVVPGPHAAGEHVSQKGLDQGGPAVAAAGISRGSQGFVWRAKVRGGGWRWDSINYQPNSIEAPHPSPAAK